jgi:hypothetical protein
MHTGKWFHYFALAALASVGCSHMSTTDKGVLAGGALGAGTGALVGNAAGNTGAGALIGGALGAIGGGLTGNAIERAEHREAAAAAAQAQGPLGLTDVVTLTMQNVSEDVIIQQIHTTGSTFHLSPGDLAYLSQNRVSDRVIQTMQATAGRPRFVRRGPLYQPVYVVEPVPPPVRVGFGVGFCH